MDFNYKPLITIVSLALAVLSGCTENDIEVEEDAQAYPINYYFEYQNLTELDITISSCLYSTAQGPGHFSDQFFWPDEASDLPANSSGTRILFWPFRSFNFIPGDASFALRLTASR